MIARNEDEFVRLALQLASDVSELSQLRISLRELMSKSPLCDGENFVLGPESTYRNMWRRYCKGDVPFLERIELLEEPVPISDPSNNTSKPTRATNSREGGPGSVNANGFN